MTNERIEAMRRMECPECGGDIQWMDRGTDKYGYSNMQLVCTNCPWDSEIDETLSIFVCEKCKAPYEFDGSVAADLGLCHGCYNERPH